VQLIEGLSEKHMLANTTYESDAIVGQAADQGMNAVTCYTKIKDQRSYYKHLYRHSGEHAFLYSNGLRGVATRYATNVSSFPAAVLYMLPNVLDCYLVTMLANPPGSELWPSFYYNTGPQS